MSDIKLDDTGDIDFTNGELSLTDGVDAVRQRLSQRLSFFLGEWFLDRTRGIPYVQQVFIKNPNPAVIDAIFKREILAEPSIRELQSFTLDLDTITRVLTITFRALTTVGPIDFEEEFGL